MSTTTRLPFDEVFADESAGNVKTPQSEYLSNGHFPVIDQGKALVAGYVNEPERICGGGRPAIVFGDHTRCVKFVDQPFCMGADGVKVLRPKIDADLKYLYYYLKQLPLPDAGYDRHFKYLKRTEVVLAPLPEQRRIAAILDKADALRTKRRESLAQLDLLAASIFLEMFGEPRQNSHGWPVYGLLEVCRPKQWATISSSDLTAEGYPVYGANGVIGRYHTFNHEDATVLITCRGATCGTINVCEPKSYVTGNSMALDNPDPAILRIHFLEWVLRIRGVGESISGSAQPQITREKLGAIKIPVPPVKLQEVFGHRIDALRATRVNLLESSMLTDALFDSLQMRAFNAHL